tara:strand:- start:1308 stop:1694 length:387 start_codon:yes stop_codon:yes gene_type:complete
MITNIFFSVKKVIVLFILVLNLSACTSQAHEKEAALLPANSEQARAEIIELISQSFGGKKIPIAEDVFQHSSRLLLGKTAVTSPEGIKVLRADKEAAIVFELVKQDDNCLLRRINSSQEWKLKTKKCF